MTRQSLVVSKTFRREEGDEKPLERCLKWRNEARREHQQDFLVVSHELSVHNREYMAMSYDEMCRWASLSLTERHFHEVIIGPTKLYADVDMVASGDCEELYQRLIEALVTEASERFGVSCDVLTLDSSNSTKFSRHLVVEMQRQGSRVRFASSLDCGMFVRQVQSKYALDKVNVNGTPLCDPHVYRRNNSFRMYGSTKSNDESRPMVVMGGSLEKSLNIETLCHSLVTWPRVGDETHLIHIDSPLTSRSSSPPTTKRSRSSSPGSIEVDGAVEEFVRSLEPLSSAPILSIRRSDTTNLLLVRVDSRACAQRGREHRSNSIYYLVDDRRLRYKQLCYSPHCDNSRAKWVSLDGVRPPDVEASPPKRACTPIEGEPSMTLSRELIKKLHQMTPVLRN